MKYADLLDKVGNFGLYQKRVYFLVSLIEAANAFFILSYVFVAARPDYWCKVPVPSNWSDGVSWDIASEDWRNKTVPMGDDYSEHDKQCTRYDVVLEDGNVTFDEKSRSKCNQWNFDTSQYHSTVVTQYELVCDRKWLRSMSQFSFMTGATLSSLVTGFLSDKWGRRPMLIWTTFLLVVCGIITPFSPNIYTFSTLRFLVAVFVTAANLVAYVLVMELVGRTWRPFAGNVIFAYWAVAYVALTPIAYFIRDHFYLQLAIALPYVGLASFYWVVPESPRWLLAQDKDTDAAALLFKMAQTNKKDLTEAEIAQDIEKLTEKSSKEEKVRENIESKPAIREPYLWKWTIIQLIVWFIIGLVYYGLSLNSSDMAGNDYLNYFLTGVVEIPAYLSCIPLLQRFSRQWLALLTLGTSGVALLLSIYLPTSNTVAIVTFTIVGKFAITSAYSVAYVYTAELYPTVVRNFGLGVCVMISKFGGAVAPFASDVADVYKDLPFTLFGCLSILGALLLFILPETLGKQLTQTIADGKRADESHKLCCRNCTSPIPQTAMERRLSVLEDEVIHL